MPTRLLRGGRDSCMCEGFSDACLMTASPGHRQQASEKRQGMKSRRWGTRRCSSDYGDLGASMLAGNEARKLSARR